MELTTLKVRDFIVELASDSPPPEEAAWQPFAVPWERP